MAARALCFVAPEGRHGPEGPVPWPGLFERGGTKPPLLGFSVFVVAIAVVRVASRRVLREVICSWNGYKFSLSVSLSLWPRQTTSQLTSAAVRLRHQHHHHES